MGTPPGAVDFTGEGNPTGSATTGGVAAAPADGSCGALAATDAAAATALAVSSGAVVGELGPNANACGTIGAASGVAAGVGVDSAPGVGLVDANA